MCLAHHSYSVNQSQDGDERGGLGKQESQPATNTCSALSISLHSCHGGVSPRPTWAPRRRLAESRHETEGSALQPSGSFSGELLGTIHIKNRSYSWARGAGMKKAIQASSSLISGEQNLLRTEGSRVPGVTWAICRELNREKTVLWRMRLAEESPRGVGMEGTRPRPRVRPHGGGSWARV